jgi:enoyl-CoA hydratase/carnithine racemase
VSEDVPAHYANTMEWVVHRDGPVATVKFGPVQRDPQDFIEHHVSLGIALEDVRFDDSVRVIVITGRDSDDIFELGRKRDETERWSFSVLDPRTRPGGAGALRGPWNLTQGVERTFQALAMMEKPVIGRLNGDAYGFALHAMWGCDIVVAREDVLCCDNHLTMHSTFPAAMAAGDGAMAFLPLFLSPTKLKEFLLLGPTWTARQLADLGAINYAMPTMAEVDAKVDEFVQAFLSRPPVPVMRTKRAINKALIQQMNLSMDYAWTAELLDHWEGTATDFQQDLTLRHDEPPWRPGPLRPRAED